MPLADPPLAAGTPPADVHALQSAWAALLAGDLGPARIALEQLPAKRLQADPTARVLAAALKLRTGALEEGLMLLEHDWSAAPPAAAGLAGALLLSAARLEQALPALARSVDGGAPDAAAHLVNLGRVLTLLGRAPEALDFLARGVAAAAEHQRSLALRSHAEALIALGRTDEALVTLPSVGDNKLLILSRAAVLAACTRHEEAVRALQDARERWPDDIDLLLLSAELAQVRGRVGEATALLRSALERHPDELPLWAQLARTARAGWHNDEARAAADRAMRLAEGQEPALQAVALAAQAHVLTEEGELSGAEVAYRKALALAHNLPPALSGLGSLLMQLGRVAEAMDCFEQLRAVAPLQGWVHLIQARKLPDDAAVLEHMERAARQPSLEGPVRPGLLLTLASAWDRMKDHARAMRLAREANETAKRLLPYDPRAHRAHVDRVMARFSRAFVDSRAGWGHPSRLPVFVLGMPRSGTTLVEQILGSHSQVFGAGELGQIGEQIAKLEAWELKLGSGLVWPECVLDLTFEESQSYAMRLLDKLRAFDASATHIIDKLPHNFEHIGLIKLLFPNATILHCRREPRDIAVSNYMTDYAAKFGGMGFSYDLGWIGEQLVDHDRLMRHWHEVFPGQIFEVVYEELVEDTEGWARRMLAHLGLPWEPQVLEFQSLERPVKTASVWQVRQPVYQTSKARWKRYEAHLGPLEEALSRIPPMPEPMPLPDLPPGLFAEGMRHLERGEPHAAQGAFESVLAVHPRHAAAQHFLGAALLQLGRVPEAVAAMRRSVRLRPGHASWFDNLAVAEAAAGHTEAEQKAREAAQKLRAAIANASTSPVANPT